MDKIHISAPNFNGVDRFRDPLYTISEAARYLGVPTSTFSTWAHGYIRRPHERPEVIGKPIVTMIGPDDDAKRHRHDPSVPFIGLAEGLILAAIRRRGVPLQRIRPALKILTDEIGLEHALASKSLYTDGADVLYDYAEREGDTPEARSARQLIVVRNGQGIFNDIVENYLHRITYGPDNYAQIIRLPQYTKADIVADPKRSFGQPIFSRGGARVKDALQLFWAGEELQSVANEFGMREEDLEDVLRDTSRWAA